MKRASLFVLIALGTVLLLGALPAKRFPYVSSALNQTRTISEFEYRILENRINTTSVPVPGGVFTIRKMDASAQRYALLVKVDVVLNPGQKPVVWGEQASNRRVRAAARSLYSLARARFGDNASFTRGVGGLIVLAAMDGKPLIAIAGIRGHHFLPDSSPTDVAKIISEYVERFRANMDG